MRFQNYFIGFFVAILLLLPFKAVWAIEGISPTVSLLDSVAEQADMITFEPLSMPKDTHTLDADLIFHKVNEYRIKHGLSPLEQSGEMYEIAKSREGQLASEITTGRIHAGFKALQLPYFATENMKFGFSEDDVVSWWLKSPIHHKSIIGDYKYSAVTCKKHVCIQLFTNFTPKKD